MKKLPLILLLLSSISFAKITTSQSTTGQVVSSDSHSVIVCLQSGGGKCMLPRGGLPGLTRFDEASPADYATALGYKTLISTGVAITPDHVYIVMEVSK